MVHTLKLIKGRSYYGAVRASWDNPVIKVDDETAYQEAMKSGYFADISGDRDSNSKIPADPDKGAGQGKEKDSDDSVSKFNGMTVEELKTYADFNGIDLKGAKTKAKIIAEIMLAEAHADEVRNSLREE